MADDQELAASVRAALAGTGVIREVRMFGGIGFMLNGNLVAAASHRGLLLRVGKDRQAEALAQSGARPMVMRGRAMEGYVYVDPPALNKRSRTGSGWRLPMGEPCRESQTGSPNREKENENEDAFRTWSLSLPRAYFCAGIRLAPDAV
jgi:TfoX/Sxy family transcriptional regulator of competence genes